MSPERFTTARIVAERNSTLETAQRDRKRVGSWLGRRMSLVTRGVQPEPTVGQSPHQEAAHVPGFTQADLDELRQEGGYSDEVFAQLQKQLEQIPSQLPAHEQVEQRPLERV